MGKITQNVVIFFKFILSVLNFAFINGLHWMVLMTFINKIKKELNSDSTKFRGRKRIKNFFIKKKNVSTLKE